MPEVRAGVEFLAFQTPLRLPEIETHVIDSVEARVEMGGCNIEAVEQPTNQYQ